MLIEEQKHFHEGYAALQIPPLRFAPVGMTKEGVVASSAFNAGRERGSN
jgi:hypothetical protein